MDEENHKYPVGPLQLKKFANPKNDDYGKTDYYRDPNALKLISQTEWSSDRPLYEHQGPSPTHRARAHRLARARAAHAQLDSVRVSIKPPFTSHRSPSP